MSSGGLDKGTGDPLQGGASGGSTASYAQPTAQSVHRAGEVREQMGEARAVWEQNSIAMVEGTPQGLRKLLRGQFGTCVCGWRRALDSQSAYRLGEVAFVKALRDMGVPNARDIFFDLGGGDTGHVQLKDVDPGGAALLDNFYRFFTRGVGPLASLTATGDSQRLTQNQFLQACKVIQRRQGESGGIGREGLEGVFRALQLGGKAGVTAADLAWLEDLCNPPERADLSARPLWQLRPHEQSSRPAAEVRPMVSTRVVDRFLAALRRSFGGVVQAWRQLLDPAGKSDVGLEGLQAACKEIGFEGSVEELWRALVRPPSQALRLDMLEPLAPVALRTFMQCCCERFGSVAQAFRNWSTAKGPLVTLKEFYTFCDEVRMPRNQRMLFELLDAHGAGMMSMAAVDYNSAVEVFGADACQEAEDNLAGLAEEAEESGGKARARRSLWAQQRELCAASRRPPEERRSRRRELTRLLEARFGSLVRAWHKQFDIKGAGKISREAFFEACAAAGFHGDQSALWKELKLEDGSQVKFRDLAPELVGAAGSFKEIANNKLADWCSRLEGESKDPKRASKYGASVSREEFRALCVDLEYEGDVDQLWSCFDIECDGKVDTKAVRAFAEARSEEKALPRLLAKHAERRQALFRKQLQGARLPAPADVAAKQDELRRSARRARAAAGRGRSAREEFLAWLRAQSGTVTRAWRLLLDPEDWGDLDESEFVGVLSQCGYFRPEDEGSDDDSPPGHELFMAVAHKVKGGGEGGKEGGAEWLVSLHDLDPGCRDAVEEFKTQCRARYGSVVRAFEEVDPDSTGTVSTTSFKAWCIEMNCSKCLKRLLDYLDAGDVGEIKLEDIDEDAASQNQEAADKRRQMEDEWREQDEEKGRIPFKEPPPIGMRVGVEARAEERAAQAGRRAAGAVRQKLARKYGTLLGAWRKSLSTTGSRSVDIHHFVRACEKAGIARDEATKAWEGMGLQDTWMTFDTLDPSMRKGLRSFKECLISRYGSLRAGLDIADKNRDLTLSKQEFLALCYDCQWKGNEHQLFEYLDTAQSGLADLCRVDRRTGLEVKRKRQAEARERKARERRKLKRAAEEAAAAGATGSRARAAAKLPDVEGAASQAPGGQPSRPSRRPAGAHSASTLSPGPSTRTALSLPEMASLGSLGSACAGSRPRLVRLRKIRSLPVLALPKPSWDHRHHVPDTPLNRLENMVHHATSIGTHKDRLAHNMDLLERELPIKDWIRQQMVAKRRHEEQLKQAARDEYPSDDDDDW
ncbi:unnamed protein product [Prorocentrum cordatum]|uniref:EF-hand domain-containing protein n=1 Tax=Prorocentrum cordatum TaxID=2364126 RepID=A0ABN9Q0X2_9DINO|nr:unnamed protein product [Polarella glacialis]